MGVNVLAVAAQRSLRLLLWQAGCTVALAAVFTAASGARAGWSALVGGGIGLIWTVYMSFALWKHSVDHGARLSAMTFVAGWIIKVVLTISLLVIALRSTAIAPLPLLGGLGGALVAYGVGLFYRVGHTGGGYGE